MLLPAEMEARIAFDRQAPVFDALYGANEIIRYKRRRVREHILSGLRQNDLMLELNCGTGEDALYFSRLGFNVHATDISPVMLQQLEQKKTAANDKRVSYECCSFNQLEKLKNKGPFDQVYSNFGGLNCTPNLGEVLCSLDPLLKPGGRITLVIISTFCFWECLLALRGHWKTAFRRFFSSQGRSACVEGSVFTCWYYKPSYVKRHLGRGYRPLHVEALCSLVPPSYYEGFAKKHPKAFRFLCRLEDKWKGRWPFRSSGDYFIISLEKRSS